MAQKKIRVSDLDFDSIKSSFVDYLKTTSEFSDYNFDASGISTLLNVLAYNTHYQSLMANFLANEMFLDTAVKRSSIVSRAKELGYVPRSRVSAKAIINVTFTNVFGAPSSLVLPAGTTFSGKVDNESYTFTTLTSYSTSPTIVGGVLNYSFSNVEVYEGVYTQNTFTYDPTSYTISLPNLDIDTSTLRVFVQTQNDSRVEEYTRNDSILTLTTFTRVFFIQEGFNELYEIYFGDGAMVPAPASGSTVEANYIVTSGAAGNNATNFSLTFFPAGTESSSVSVSTVTSSSGGQDREANALIKFNAINSYGTQNRAVIANDYKSLIAGTGINVKNVLAWGGEDNIPPKFGTIVVCVEPLVGDSLTGYQKTIISMIVKSKAVGNTKIEFVDPEYIDLKLSTNIVYDKSNLSVGTYELESEVRSTIINYATTALSTFSNVFRISNLMSDIDSTNIAILNNQTNVLMEKWLYPRSYSTYSTTFSFMNPVMSLYSTYFSNGEISAQLRIEDDTFGKLNVVYYVGTNKIIFKPNVGTINYESGDVTIDNLAISVFEGSELRCVAMPLNQDVISDRNVILRLQNGNISVSSMPDYL